MSARTRCFVCGARGWRRADRELRCDHCGVRVRVDHDRGECVDALGALLRPGPCALARDLPFAADIYTLRIAASRVGLAAWPCDRMTAEALAYPHSVRPARAWLRPRAPAPPRVALGMILRADAVERTLERIGPWRARFAGIVLVVDDAAREPVQRDGATVLHRPLGKDFAAQRNAVQRAASARWVLQLDDDETPSDALLHAMDAISAHADAQNVVSVGFPRRNLVDGAWSDLWPDVQYRLNRREVRFAGAVHERPAVPGGWRHTTIALDGVIDHYLERARVEERSRRYEAMRGGAGRPGDEMALLRPFAP